MACVASCCFASGHQTVRSGTQDRKLRPQGARLARHQIRSCKSSMQIEALPLGADLGELIDVPRGCCFQESRGAHIADT